VIAVLVKGKDSAPLAAQDVGTALASVPGVSAVEPVDSEGEGILGFRVRASGDSDPREGIFHAAVQADFVLLGIRRERVSLEDTFRQLTVGEGGSHA